MSTWCAVHIKSEQTEEVVAEIARLLTGTHEGALDSSDVGTPEAIYGERFLISEKPPTVFAVGAWPKGWTTVHFNSFNRMSKFAASVSDGLRTYVLTVMMQSVSETYFIEVFRNGTCLRTLCYSGDQGAWEEQVGEPLPFEKKVLGRNIADSGEDPFFVFGREDTEEYCAQLGLDLNANTAGIPWRLISVPDAMPISRVSPDNGAGGKKWWQFW